MWYTNKLKQHKSLGSLAERPGSLGNLHETRKNTLSQFFTPLWLVKKIYKAIDTCKTEYARPISIFDNSCGSGRFFAYADAKKHSIHGVDIEESAISLLENQANENGIPCEFVTASMVDVRLGSFDFGFINPPFSIHLDSPFIKHEKGVTCYGKFGPDTSTTSHAFALTQALRCCSVVVALIPRTLTLAIQNNEIPKAKKHLTHIYALPKNTFEDEGITSITCDLCVFDTRLTTKNTITQPLTEDDQLMPISGVLPHTRAMITNRHIDVKTPVITLPVTGDNTVILRRKGRTIDLDFNCGLMQAKAMNAIYRERLFSTSEHRYPKTTKYRGQHLLDMYVLASQQDPIKALKQLEIRLSTFGANVIIKPCVIHGLKAIKRHEDRQSAPFSHTIYQQTIKPLTAKAKRFGLLTSKPADGVVKMGQEYVVNRTEKGFLINLSNEQKTEVEHDQFFNLFALGDKDANSGNWVEKYGSLALKHPSHFNQLANKATRLGLKEWLTFEDYQLTDLLELAFKPRGAVCGWEMGLGKARLTLALCMMGGSHNLLVVKSRLVDEMLKECKSLNLDPSLFQVLKTEQDCKHLKKINIVSYDRAKAVLKGHKKKSIAKLLRGRIHTLCADEGGLLSNPNSAQSRAIAIINPKKRYAFDGTPIANYVRHMLPLCEWTHGHSRPSQPYSSRGEYFYPNLINGARYQQTGIKAFADSFVCVAWATSEFTDSLTAGAKREIPKINNVVEFRNWISGSVKRRVQQEPAVRKYVKFPIPTLHEPDVVEWKGDGHLNHYIRVVDYFATWYSDQLKKANNTGKNVNLAIVLAKLDAAFKAIQRPEDMGSYPKNYYGANAKDDWCINSIQREVNQGNRTIVYARNPMVLERLSKQLDEINISNMVFTGQENITKRNKRLDSEFREGDKQVLLASIGAAQDGLNLYQANSVVFYNRSFNAREEFQAIARVLRPQQTKEVNVFFGHARGSLDVYQAQMINWKQESTKSGLDYGSFDADQHSFVHYSTFFERFINSSDELKALRESVRQAA